MTAYQDEDWEEFLNAGSPIGTRLLSRSRGWRRSRNERVRLLVESGICRITIESDRALLSEVKVAGVSFQLQAGEMV